MTDAEVAKIAGALTKAQWEAVLAAVDYEDGSALFRLGSGRGMCPLGLGQRAIDGIELTPLGLRVRAHLLQENQHG